MAEEDNKEDQQQSEDGNFSDGIDDSAIQKRLSELEAELAIEIANENESFTINSSTKDTLSTKVADSSEGLTDAEIDEKVESSTTMAADYHLAQASKPSILDNISASELAIEDDVSDEKVVECLNCAAELQGPYCHNCGQPDRHFIRFFPKVLLEMVNEAFDLDSRALRTLVPLMFSPGRLSMEYISGRRARYVNPLRLYIILSVVFFISISLFTSSNNDFNVENNEGVNTRIYVNDTNDSDGNDDQLDANNAQSAKSIEEQIELLKSLEEQKVNGAAITDEEIENIKSVIEKLENNSNESTNIKTNILDEKGDLNVTLSNGKKWNLETNQVQFFDALSEETTRELNEFLWTMGLKLDKAIKNDPSDLIDEFFNAIPQLMFILLPLFAVLLKMTYIFKKRYYMEHLIVALHSHCFIFFSLILLVIFSSINESLLEPEWLKDGLGYATIALSIWIPLNIYITQKRIYAQGYIMTTIKFIFVGIAYMALLMMTSALAFVVGLASL